MSRLGPGLITGAADDDPSGIATYSQAGAQFRFGLLWTMLLTTPLMIGIQALSARIGWVTGKGLAANMLRFCPRWLAATLVLSLVVANTINIAADVAAMGEALQLLVGGGEHGHALVMGVLCVVFQLAFPYERTVRLLKWLTLTLFAYVAVLLAVQVPWGEALHRSLLPWTEAAIAAQWSDYATLVVAVLGTTISPYLFFWQAAQEVEEHHKRPDAVAIEHREPRGTARHLRRIKIDTVVGMSFSNLIAVCIMLATAVTLHAHGVTTIQTSAQAADALRPLAGPFAFLLFALGIIGTGLLAVPVLAGSAAYAVSEVFGWRAGYDHGFHEARGFYVLIIAATLGGSFLDFTPIDPITALVWSAIVNGVISVPIMAVMMAIGCSRRIMGDLVITTRHRVLGWIATGVMAVAVAIMLLAFLR